MSPKLEHETELKYVSPDLLDFDPTNPRFGGLMEKRSQPDIQQELVREPYYALELVDSLLKNGFIDYEPLVVKKSGNRYIVVEGKPPTGSDKGNFSTQRPLRGAHRRSKRNSSAHIS